jgi:hypothetical protein
VGERHLPAAPFIECLDDKLPKMKVATQQDGNLRVWWGEGTIPESVVDSAWLKAYADKVGKEVTPAWDAGRDNEPAEYDLLESFLEKQEGMAKEKLNLFKNDGNFSIPRISYNELEGSPMKLWQRLMDPGIAIITGMPDDAKKDGSVLKKFGADFFTGLQKHPLREEPHWVISTQDDVQMHDTNFSEDVEGRSGQNSYNTEQQLANHTDQVLYGAPGALLMFHCCWGQGGNSITDGFAASYALQERHPEMFKLLTKYGLNLGRRLEYYEAGDMTFNLANPVLKTDAAGNLSRIAYNEIYRVPLTTVPFEEYPQYIKALQTWYQFVHSPEFQMHITLYEGELIIMNNWRVMHGRAGLKGKKRIIMGGTVTREAFLSKVRKHYQETLEVPDELETGMTIDLYAKYRSACNKD